MEIRKINSNTPSFTNSGKIGLGLKTASKICSIQEGGAGLSHIKSARIMIIPLLWIHLIRR